MYYSSSKKIQRSAFLLAIAQLVEHMTVVVYRYHKVIGSIPICENYS